MSLWDEFKAFSMKGNMVDLAIGVIIGAAFGKVISSLVSDVIMPPIGYLIGGIDFSKLAWTLNPGAEAPVTIRYGQFLNTIIDFLIIAFVIFAVIKFMNRMRGTKPEEAKTKECPECLMTIPAKATRCGHCCCQIK